MDMWLCVYAWGIVSGRLTRHRYAPGWMLYFPMSVWLSIPPVINSPFSLVFYRMHTPNTHCRKQESVWRRNHVNAGCVKETSCAKFIRYPCAQIMSARACSLHRSGAACMCSVSAVRHCSMCVFIQCLRYRKACLQAAAIALRFLHNACCALTAQLPTFICLLLTMAYVHASFPGCI